MPTETHDLLIGEDFIDGTYCAECSCGWEGNERNAEIDAIAEWENHCEGEIEDYFGADEPNCQTCGGDGVEECQDVNSAEGCWESDCNGDIHTCPNCRGSGRAKDQWYW